MGVCDLDKITSSALLISAGFKPGNGEEEYWTLSFEGGHPKPSHCHRETSAELMPSDDITNPCKTYADSNLYGLIDAQ